MTADVLFPTSADEAASLYGDGAGITVFAGGTILLPEIAAGRVKPERALMLHRTGLDAPARRRRSRRDRRDGCRSPHCSRHPTRRSPNVARHVADGEVRRNATVGGNLSAPAASDAQRGDLGAPLIALGARVRSTGAGGERTEPVEDFLAGDRGRAARARDRVRPVRAPHRRERASGAATPTRTRSPVSSRARAPDGSDLRVAVSGVGPTAVRCRTVEAEPRPGRRARATSSRSTTPSPPPPTAARCLPKLVREALDQLELA